MSRLNDLLYQLRVKEPQLAQDLEGEFAALADRRAFGLNFERHVPEDVELPGRKMRRGDKVHILPPRRGLPNKSSERLWRVLDIDRAAGMATLEALDTPVDEEGEVPLETTKAAVDDLVVVAEFRDPIYPGLASTGRVECGGDKPFHIVINAENYHALETLLFTHRSKVDVIYIDPPYNSGATDWKYNNHYVESDDLYRHSKWLAMMERRLLLAKELLDPDDSVLIVAIDEKEYLRLGMLLEQVYPEATIQMVTTVVKPEGTGRKLDEFSRTNEFLFFVMIGASVIAPQRDNMFDRDGTEGEPDASVEWRNLRRREKTSKRGSRKNQFYAVFVDERTGQIHSVGDALPDDVTRFTVTAPDGSRAVFPLTPAGVEMIWGMVPDSFRELVASGYARTNGDTIQFLNSGVVAGISSGEIVVTGHDSQGAVVAEYADGSKRLMPKTVWVRDSHNAQASGTLLVKKFIPGRDFPFPKSLYAVEDALRFFVQNNPDALIVDFFGGSGTTTHAVARLNRQDGGRRRSVLVTNNEVAAAEQKALREKGLRAGDAEWEQWGICEYITKPRIVAAMTGATPEGTPINGNYKFTDEFPMADGFQENVEFFTLTYEAPLRVASNREFAKIAPLLWIRAGARGRRIEDISTGWDVADTYGVLVDLDRTEDFLKSVAAKRDGLTIAYIVTDEDRLFESVSQELPDNVEPVRLYEAYLRNFEIESGRGAL